MVSKALFSSKSDEWETPQWLFDKLNSMYGPFDLDVCANYLNNKCEIYLGSHQFGATIDSLNVNWSQCSKKCWMNPPYSRGLQKKFIEKAYKESQKGCIVVCLIPARTDTKLWHDYVMKASEILFIKGRLKFGASENSAPFPSAIVIFKPGNNVPIFGSFNK